MLCGRVTCKQVTVSLRYKTPFLSRSLFISVNTVASRALWISRDHVAFVPIVFMLNFEQKWVEREPLRLLKFWIYLALTIIAATALSNQVLMQNLIVLVMIFSANKQSTSKKMLNTKCFMSLWLQKEAHEQDHTINQKISTQQSQN